MKYRESPTPRLIPLLGRSLLVSLISVQLILPPVTQADDPPGVDSVRREVQRGLGEIATAQQRGFLSRRRMEALVSEGERVERRAIEAGARLHRVDGRLKRLLEQDRQSEISGIVQAEHRRLVRIEASMLRWKEALESEINRPNSPSSMSHLNRFQLVSMYFAGIESVLAARYYHPEIAALRGQTANGTGSDRTSFYDASLCLHVRNEIASQMNQLRPVRSAYGEQVYRTSSRTVEEEWHGENQRVQLYCPSPSFIEGIQIRSTIEGQDGNGLMRYVKYVAIRQLMKNFMDAERLRNHFTPEERAQKRRGNYLPSVPQQFSSQMAAAENSSLHRAVQELDVMPRERRFRSQLKQAILGHYDEFPDFVDEPLARALLGIITDRSDRLTENQVRLFTRLLNESVENEMCPQMTRGQTPAQLGVMRAPDQNEDNCIKVVIERLIEKSSLRLSDDRSHPRRLKRRVRMFIGYAKSITLIEFLKRTRIDRLNHAYIEVSGVAAEMRRQQEESSAVVQRLMVGVEAVPPEFDSETRESQDFEWSNILITQNEMNQILRAVVYFRDHYAENMDYQMISQIVAGAPSDRDTNRSDRYQFVEDMIARAVALSERTSGNLRAQPLDLKIAFQVAMTKRNLRGEVAASRVSARVAGMFQGMLSRGYAAARDSYTRMMGVLVHPSVLSGGLVDKGRVQFFVENFDFQTRYQSVDFLNQDVPNASELRDPLTHTFVTSRREDLADMMTIADFFDFHRRPSRSEMTVGDWVANDDELSAYQEQYFKTQEALYPFLSAEVTSDSLREGENFECDPHTLHISCYPKDGVDLSGGQKLYQVLAALPVRSTSSRTSLGSPQQERRSLKKASALIEFAIRNAQAKSRESIVEIANSTEPADVGVLLESALIEQVVIQSAPRFAVDVEDLQAELAHTPLMENLSLWYMGIPYTPIILLQMSNFFTGRIGRFFTGRMGRVASWFIRSEQSAVVRFLEYRIHHPVSVFYSGVQPMIRGLELAFAVPMAYDAVNIYSHATAARRRYHLMDNMMQSSVRQAAVFNADQVEEAQQEFWMVAGTAGALVGMIGLTGLFLGARGFVTRTYALGRLSRMERAARALELSANEVFDAAAIERQLTVLRGHEHLTQEQVNLLERSARYLTSEREAGRAMDFAEWQRALRTNQELPTTQQEFMEAYRRGATEWMPEWRRLRESRYRFMNEQERARLLPILTGWRRVVAEQLERRGGMATILEAASSHSRIVRAQQALGAQRDALSALLRRGQLEGPELEQAVESHREAMLRFAELTGMSTDPSAEAGSFAADAFRVNFHAHANPETRVSWSTRPTDLSGRPISRAMVTHFSTVDNLPDEFLDLVLFDPRREQPFSLLPAAEGRPPSQVPPPAGSTPRSRPTADQDLNVYEGGE